MIKTTIHVAIRGVAILSVQVSISVRDGDSNLIVSTKLVAVNGKESYIDGQPWGPYINGGLLKTLKVEYGVTVEDYNNALYVADLRAREQIVAVEPIPN